MKNRINADQEKTRDFHQYTVGEMAALLSMSAPTIRFYDSQGAVVPHRDEENQYRKYTVVDGNYLIKMKELKNIGASLQESVQLLNDVDLTGYCDGFRQLEQADLRAPHREAAGEADAPHAHHPFHGAVRGVARRRRLGQRAYAHR